MVYNNEITCHIIERVTEPTRHAVIQVHEKAAFGAETCSAYSGQVALPKHPVCSLRGAYSRGQGG